MSIFLKFLEQRNIRTYKSCH